MTSARWDSDDSLPPEIHEKIGDLLKRFEDAWQAQQSPLIEHYLPEVDEAYHPVLFRELLRLELDQRVRSGQAVEPAPYANRFPQFQALVERVFQETRAPAVDPHDWEVLPDDLPRFGPYLATRELGRGGFGAVYLATHDETGHQVAIKVGGELLHEAKTLLSLKHPSIIRVLHVGRDSKNRSYLVMDYMQGGSLRDRIDPEHPMLPEEAIEIGARIAEALHAAHSHPAQIYHRDLKPENVLFDEDGNVCVADFGLAINEAEQAAQRGNVSGTLAHQSPEQVRGEADWIDARSDVWAVGVILYEMLTGRRPFTGENLREQILHKNPKSPRQVSTRVPEALEAICLKCLEKDAKTRYQTADALARALRGQELGVNPYKGLAAFEESDADLFFGREEQIERLRLLFQELYERSSEEEATSRILAIIGPSGCGKSSLVKAGLIPTLKRHPLMSGQVFQVDVVTPKEHPVESLAAALARFATNDLLPVAKTREFASELATQNSSGEYDGLRRIVSLLPQLETSPLVLVIDQFEEIYSQCNDPEERNRFIESLLCAARDRNGRTSIVLTLRSDFLAHTQEHEALNSVIASQEVIIPAMTQKELRQAIELPAKKAGYNFEGAFTDLLVSETIGREGALPLLQFALSRVWDELAKGIDPTHTLREIGGVGGALASQAQQIYDKLQEDEKRIARRIFLSLVQLGEGTSDTRRRVSLEDIASHSEEPKQLRRVVERFSTKAARLITLASETDGAITAEITHETLIQNWTTFREWLEDSRENIRFQRRLDGEASRWQEMGRPEGLLWRSPDLDILRKYCETNVDQLGSTSLAFFQASDERSRQERRLARQRLNRYRAMAGVFGALLVATILSGSFAYRYYSGLIETSWQLKNRERAVAEAEYSARWYETQGLLLARPAGWSAQCYRNIRNLSAARSDDNRRHELLGLAIQCISTPDAVESYRLPGHKEAVWAVEYSSAGNQIVTAGYDGRVCFWDTTAKQLQNEFVDPFYNPRYHYSFRSPYPAVSVSPDGKRVAYSLWKGGVAIAGVPAFDVVATLQPKQESTRSESLDRLLPISVPAYAHQVAFADSGNKIAVSWSHGTVGLYDASSGRAIFESATTRAPEVTPSPVAVTLNGDKLAASDGENNVILFDTSGDSADAAESSRQQLSKHADLVSTLCFSPDGATLASGSHDRIVIIYDTSAKAEVTRLVGHSDRVKCVRFSPDGRIVATAADDGEVRLWERDTGRMLLRLNPDDGAILGLAFSQSADELAVTGQQVTVYQLANLSTLRELWGHSYYVCGCGFSPSGELLATGSADSCAVVWDVASGRLLEKIQLYGVKFVRDIAFLADGQTTVASFSSAYNQQQSPSYLPIWKPNTPLFRDDALRGHRRDICSFNVDRSHQWLVSCDSTGQVIVWHLWTRQKVAEWTTQSPVFYAAFLDGANQVITATTGQKGSNTIELTVTPVANPSDTSQTGVTVSSGECVVCTSHDGCWLAIADSKRVRLFETATLKEMPGAAWDGVPHPTAISFTPNGRFLAIADATGPVSFWSIDAHRLVFEIPKPKPYARGLSFSPEGAYLAVCAQEQKVSLWNLAALEKTLKELGLLQEVSLTGKSGHKPVRVSPALASGERESSFRVDGAGRFRVANVHGDVTVSAKDGQSPATITVVSNDGVFERFSFEVVDADTAESTVALGECHGTKWNTIGFRFDCSGPSSPPEDWQSLKAREPDFLSDAYPTIIDPESLGHIAGIADAVFELNGGIYRIVPGGSRMKVFCDDKLLLDSWESIRDFSGDCEIELGAGQHRIHVECYTHSSRLQLPRLIRAEATE